MPLRDHSQDDDFYGQGFSRKGVVSVWVGTTPAPADARVDTLQDLCGVGYYRLSDQESNACDGDAATDLATLFEPISYASSFLPAVLDAAWQAGISKAFWITVQFDFEYRKEAVRRPIAPQPVFLGAFPYSDDD